MFNKQPNTPQSEEKPKKEVLEMVRAFLNNKAFEHKEEETIEEGKKIETKVFFRFNGGNYIIHILEGDKEFIRVVFPSFCEIRTPQFLELVLWLSNQMQFRTKGLKMIASAPDETSPGNISAVMDLFITSEEGFEELIDRSIITVTNSALELLQTLSVNHPINDEVGEEMGEKYANDPGHLGKPKKNILN